MNPGIPKKAVPPHCADCGHSQCAAVRKPGFTDEQIAKDGGIGAYDWLCGDCLYRREHPDAEPAIALPRERVVPLQREKPWDDNAA